MMCLAMLNWFSKSLKDELYATKNVVVCGVRFKIRKVNLLDYLEGSQVLLQQFDIHKTAGQKKAEQTILPSEKIKRHYKDMLCAGVVEPKLSMNPKDNEIQVDDLFINFEMVTGLYMEILNHTYGKKKLSRLLSAANESLKSTT